MAMHKKDYELVARVLNYEKPDDENNKQSMNNWVMTCRALATAFQLQNNRFDRDKFLTACGVK